jgi:hypothetical protein
MIERATPAADLNPRIHPKLNELIMQCVEVNPERRPDSMSIVADKLNLILGILRAHRKDDSGNPISVRPSGPHRQPLRAVGGVGGVGEAGAGDAGQVGDTGTAEAV